MFDIEKFYKDAEAGEKVDEAGFLNYLHGFKNIVIWGAGNLGTALGKKMLDKGVHISIYWDARYEEIKYCNGISVVENFSGDFNPEETMVIIGIVNGTRGHRWQVSELEQKGYYHSLYGMRVYEGIGCEMYVGQPLDVMRCTNGSICNFNTCKKYLNILKSNVAQGKKDLISIHVLEFIVSHRCTLDCVHCGQFVGVIKRRKPENSIDYPLERIKKDIDICMENIDAVGTFSIIGGEPFIHPDIFEIIEHCLTKKNVAIISITTNGICNMPLQKLKNIRDPRIKINFSNYTAALDEKKKRLFEENVEKVKEAGLNWNVTVPIWTNTTEEFSENPDTSVEYLSRLKEQCNMGPSVSNGVFYACPTIEAYSKTGGMSVENQYIVLDTAKDLRSEIKELINRPYFDCCGGRCGNAKTSYDVFPGEQYIEHKGE